MFPARRVRLMAEMAALYALVPLLVLAIVHLAQISLIIVLAPVLALVVLVLALDGTFSWRNVLRTGIARRQLHEILALFIVLGGAITLFVYFWLPESFLSFPRERARLWLIVMLFYPLVSVTAQELVYRVLFLHRYGALFAGNLYVAVPVNAVLFAFGHIYFGSWVTVAVSFAGGLIFAYRYLTTRSFWAVFLEHSLYGMLIFTVGLGRYFFTGAPFG